MAGFLMVTIVLVAVLGTNGTIWDVKTANEGTDITFSISSSAGTDISIAKASFVFNRFFIFAKHFSKNFGDRLTIVRESEDWWNINIKNVSKDDRGWYSMHSMHCYYRKRVVRQDCILFYLKIIIDESSFKYNETVLLEDGSNSTLIFLHNSYEHPRQTPFVIRFNGTNWAAFTNDERFNWFRQNDSLAMFRIYDMRTDDEGIYYLMYDTWHDRGYTRQRDSIRVLIKELTFMGNGNENITYGSEGQMITLVCEVFGSFDVSELYIESTKGKVATGNPSRINFTFLANRRDHLSQYTCKANITNYQSTIATDIQVIVFYPPSVQIKEATDKQSVFCLAHGHPTNYTYYWTSTGFHDTVQNVTGISNETLIFTQKITSFREIVIYKCFVSNGIRNVHGQLYQEAQKRLFLDLRFTNQDKEKFTHGTEGHIMELVCEVHADYFYDVVELHIETNGHKVLSGIPPRIGFSFLPRRSDHFSQYTCEAKIENYKTRISTYTKLIISYPPSVQIEQSTDKKSVHCLADGYPANYTYFWTICFETCNEVQNFTGLSNGTLILQQNTTEFHESVTYTCYVSNGIRDSHGQLYQTDQRLFQKGHAHSIKFGRSNIAMTLNFIGIVAVFFFLYTIVLQFVCCYQRKKMISYSQDGTQVNEYDEIGTLHYQSFTIPPVLVRGIMSDENASVHPDDIRQAIENVENVDQAYPNEQIISGRSSSDDNSNESILGNPNGSNHQTSNSPSDEEEVEGIPMEMTENRTRNYGGNSSDETSNDDTEGDFHQPRAETEYEHLDTQTLTEQQDEHKYSDCLTRYINSEVRPYVNIRQEETYINLRVWES